MSEKTEITFMQTRLIRLASEEWHLPVEQIIHLFKEADVLGYIEKCYTHFSYLAGKPTPLAFSALQSRAQQGIQAL